MSMRIHPADRPAVQPGPLAQWMSRMLRSRYWRQRELALRMGVQPSMISKWVRGVRIPDPPHCRAIAAAFDVPLNEVLRLAGHVPADQPLVDDHPVRARLHALVDVMDPVILEHHLALMERTHALLEAEEQTRDG